jgi:hypothetical protein
MRDRAAFLVPTVVMCNKHCAGEKAVRSLMLHGRNMDLPIRLKIGLLHSYPWKTSLVCSHPVVADTGH